MISKKCRIFRVAILDYRMAIFFAWWNLRSMVLHAMQWAEGQGLTRTNVVHGKTEYRVPTDFNFGHKDVDRTTTRASSSVEVEASPCHSASRQWLLQTLASARYGHVLYWFHAGWAWIACGRECWSHGRQAHEETLAVSSYIYFVCLAAWVPSCILIQYGYVLKYGYLNSSKFLGYP